MLTLKTEIRDKKSNLDKIRKEGKLPAVFYGAKNKPTSIIINDREFEKVWKQAGESTTITLETSKNKVDVLIHDVQLHPVKSIPIHVDFLVIDTTKEVEIEVPINFVGISPAIKAGFGILVKTLHELEIKALPKNLPREIEVDISKLEKLGDQILVKDIKLPLGVFFITKEDEVIVLISAQKEETEEIKEEIGLEDIKVEKKGKEVSSEEKTDPSDTNTKNTENKKS